MNLGFYLGMCFFQELGDLFGVFLAETVFERYILPGTHIGGIVRPAKVEHLAGHVAFGELPTDHIDD